MRTLRQARPRPFGRLHSAFGARDAGEALVGSVLFGILRAVEFQEVEADLLFGVIPVRLVGVLVIAAVSAFVLLTVWGRVGWAEPRVAAGQTLVTALVVAVGASLGDILPEARDAPPGAPTARCRPPGGAVCPRPPVKLSTGPGYPR